MRVIIVALLTVTFAFTAFAQQAARLGKPADQAERPALKTREAGIPTAEAQPEQAPKPKWIIPTGTRIPVQLRQAISTKSAQPGDPIYGQTTFPVVVGDQVMIPAGTYVQGVVDNVKRAGRVKGTAELGFHLTTLLYPNGYALNMKAAIDQVPGDESSHVKEPGTVTHDSEKGKDLERVGRNASQGAAIGSMAGAAISPSIRGLGVGGLSGIAAGTLIGILARGSDVRFETGTVVDVTIDHALAIDPEKLMRPSNVPAYYPVQPYYQQTYPAPRPPGH